MTSSSDQFSANVNYGATLGGSGVVGDVVFASGGTLAPGHSPGILTVAGDFVHDVDARLVMETDRMLVGVDSDLLRALGIVDLRDGPVDSVLLNGFAPRAGDEFALFDVAGACTDSLHYGILGLLDGWAFDTRFDAPNHRLLLSSNNTRSIESPSPNAFDLLLGAIALYSVRLATRHRAPRCGKLSR